MPLVIPFKIITEIDTLRMIFHVAFIPILMLIKHYFLSFIPHLRLIFCIFIKYGNIGYILNAIYFDDQGVYSMIFLELIYSQIFN